MSRAHSDDFAYEHHVRAVPAPQVAPPRPLAEGRDLAARLLCLKALMDAERSGFDTRAPTPKRALQS